MSTCSTRPTTSLSASSHHVFPITTPSALVQWRTSQMTKAGSSSTYSTTAKLPSKPIMVYTSAELPIATMLSIISTTSNLPRATSTLPVSSRSTTHRKEVLLRTLVPSHWRPTTVAMWHPLVIQIPSSHWLPNHTSFFSCLPGVVQLGGSSSHVVTDGGKQPRRPRKGRAELGIFFRHTAFLRGTFWIWFLCMDLYRTIDL